MKAVIKANFYENINAHYKTHAFSMSLCKKKTCLDDKKTLT